MPENRRIFLCGSGVIVASFAARLFAPRCRLEQAAQSAIDDPKWGRIANLDHTRVENADAFEATAASGYHRILRNAIVKNPGRYRVSIETQFDGTPDFAIEIGGAGQSYAFVVTNLRTGKIERTHGTDIAAASEPLGEPSRYRWWVDQNYVAGQVDYNFTILSNGAATTYPGIGRCRVVLANPDFRPVSP
jgi:hypothetical protein